MLGLSVVTVKDPRNNLRFSLKMCSAQGYFFQRLKLFEIPCVGSVLICQDTTPASANTQASSFITYTYN